MSKEIVGTMPTPYGIATAVYALNDPKDPEAVFFDVDGLMDMAGLHDPAARAKCKAQAQLSGFDITRLLSLVFQSGGGPVPRQRLTPVQSNDSIYNAIPFELDCKEIIDNWVTRIADETRWCDRGRHLIEMMADNAKQFIGSLPDEGIGFVVSKMVTAVLENLGEKEIDCIEAASFYALAEHPQWREAGVKWLTPFRRSWFADWANNRPNYGLVARMVVEVYNDLPEWLALGRRA